VGRRRLEIALGALWLLDGVLQFQPFMFTREFFLGIVGMANMGLPGPLSAVDSQVANLLVAHPVEWNAAFASLQVLLGLGLIYRRTARVALVASVPWALGVWVIGEGVGGLFMPGTSLLTGAPGAAVLYAVVAVVLWPTLPARVRDGIGRGAWLAVWAGSALLELEGINHAPAVPAAQIAYGGAGQPGWLRWLDQSVGHLIGQHGGEFALVLAVAAVLIGLGVLWPTSRRPALLAGAVLGAAMGLVGQDIGGIATGHGTDPGAGPLLVLLACALWPVRTPATAPARTVRVPVHESLAVRAIPAASLSVGMPHEG
jgi:hypothetical protein